MRVYNETFEVEDSEFFLYPEHYQGQEKEWYHGQNVAIHSCLKQTQRLGFDWVLFGDLDEFLYFQDESLRHFLAHFSEMSHISLGKHMISRTFCSESARGPNELFRSLYRPESPYCSYEDGNHLRSFEYCDVYFGRRKVNSITDKFVYKKTRSLTTSVSEFISFTMSRTQVSQT